MSSKLVRLFVGISIISLTGFVAAACSSTTTTTTENGGDDDDDNTDAGKTSPTGDPTCNPAGSWEFSKITATGAGPCEEFAKTANAAQSAGTHVFTTDDNTHFTETEPGDPKDKPLRVDIDHDSASACALFGSEDPITQSYTTSKGEPAERKLFPIDYFTFTGDTLTVKYEIQVIAVDDGYPCMVTAVGTGTRKK